MKVWWILIFLGLVRLQELLKAPTQSDVKIVVRQLSFKEDKNRWELLPLFSRFNLKISHNNKYLWDEVKYYINITREILKEIKQSGEIHLVLDCDFDMVRLINLIPLWYSLSIRIFLDSRSFERCSICWTDDCLS